VNHGRNNAGGEADQKRNSQAWSWHCSTPGVNRVSWYLFLLAHSAAMWNHQVSRT